MVPPPDTPTGPLRLIERTTVAVGPDEFADLSETASLAAMLDEGVLSLVRSHTTPFGVRSGPWVGQIVLPSGRRVRIEEKLPGMFLGLLRRTGPKVLRPIALPSPASEFLLGQMLLIDRLLQTVTDYYASGRRARFAPVLNANSSPRGRLDIMRTVRLRSSGRAGVIATQSSALTRRTLPNNLIASALAVTEAIARDIDDSRLRATIRQMAQNFADCDSLTWLQRPRSIRAEAIRVAIEPLDGDDPLRDALAYARVMLLGLGAWDGDQEGHLPHGFFVSLESLFEEAVWATCHALWPLRARRGKDLGVRLFPDRPSGYVVDPDIVLNSDHDEPPLTIDVKYKDLGGPPGHSDVYQLLTHAAALGSRRAALVYPGAVANVSRVGTTGSGVRLFVATVTIDRLDDDLAEAVATITADGS